MLNLDFSLSMGKIIISRSNLSGFWGNGELQIFRFVITFALCFTIGKVDRLVSEHLRLKRRSNPHTLLALLLKFEEDL